MFVQKARSKTEHMRRRSIVVPIALLVGSLCLIHFWTSRDVTGANNSIGLPRWSGHATGQHKDESVDDLEFPSDIEYNQSYLPVITEGQEELNLLRTEGRSMRLSKLNFNNMTTREISLTCHSYLENAKVICRRKLRLGHIGDGGWDMCDDIEIRPQPPCIIYSFGIGKDFSFDDAVSKLYKCHVFSFDPTIAQKSYNRSEFVHFYEIGITERFRKLQPNYYTFNHIRSMLQHPKNTVRIIKMDIEGNEWPVLLQMLRTNEFEHIDQLLIEFHLFDMRKTYLLQCMKALRGLEMAGMRIVHTQKNEGCSILLPGFPATASRCFNVLFRKHPDFV